MPLYEPSEMFVKGEAQYSGRLFNTQAVTTGGNVTFHITDKETPAGRAIFESIVAESIIMNAVSTTMPLAFGTPVISANMKSVTVPVFQPSSSNSFVTVLGIKVLSGTSIIPSPAPDGITIRMILQGIE